jgi:hypothetical protein
MYLQGWKFDGLYSSKEEWRGKIRTSKEWLIIAYNGMELYAAGLF